MAGGKDAKELWQQDVRRIARGIRRRVAEHVLLNGGGYLSQACSSAEIFSVLYARVMNLAPVEKPLVPAPFGGVPSEKNLSYRTGGYFNGAPSAGADRFFLSPSQYSLVLYAALVETGRMAPEGLLQFNGDGSSVEMIGAEHSPGMEIMSGSLGQGISQAAGIAMARKRRGESGRVWLFMSDGEFQIGQTWEALQAMAWHNLDNMGIFIDANGYQCDGSVASVMNIEPLDRRLDAFGAAVVKVNGHDADALAEAAAQIGGGRPLAVICATCPWQGLEILKERDPRFHYVRFSSEEERLRYKQAISSAFQ
ncbi:MAG: transketolase [Elusimicrobia bacterium RIFOXYA2_FULL_50_26]|nr:MAG: transketolase [Elusimicrobia bacterium RIFOXYA2_FULL_50_26]OGS24268.1 MAG: transketolase [Elusimicrobia bacterium RIFOXYB2_FULL_50_12]